MNGDWWLVRGCVEFGLIEDPPSCPWEASVEYIEEFARGGCERGGFVVDVGDGAGPVCGIKVTLGADALMMGAGGRGGNNSAGMQDACGVYPPDDLVCGDHIGTFPQQDRPIEWGAQEGMVS